MKLEAQSRLKAAAPKTRYLKQSGKGWTTSYHDAGLWDEKPAKDHAKRVGMNSKVQQDVSGDWLVVTEEKPTKTTASNIKEDVKGINNEKLQAAVLKFSQSFKVGSVGTDGYENEGTDYGCEFDFEPTTEAAGSYERGLSMADLKKIAQLFGTFPDAVLCHGEDGNFRMAIVGDK